jgi:hypothetical protein
MKLPWHNQTTIQKIIAISAAVCILSFGLCSVGIFASLRSDRWFRLAPALARICAPTVILSFALTLGLYAWDQFRPKRK